MRHLLVIAALFSLGCPPSDGDDDFTTGDFEFETIGVEDGCFDGGFDVIFMPNGPDTPNDFGSAISVPAVAELPATYTIDLTDPFNDMEVTVTGDAATRTITGAQNTGVELDATDYPGCLVDMSIDVELTVTDADNVQGTAVLNTASFDEENCPVVTADPCDITLDIVGTRSAMR